VGTIALLSLTSALNPTLIAATTVMLLLPHPKRLMLGYLAGAFAMSIPLGLVIVFTLSGTSAIHTTQHTLSPAVDIALGVIALVLATVVGSGRTERVIEHRRETKAERDKPPPRWQRVLSKGSARTTFVVGALLTLPGASYLAGLDAMSKLDVSSAVIVLIVIGFNIVMLALLEGPLLCFAVAPDWTPGALERGKAYLERRGLKLAQRAMILLGAALILKGVIGLIAG
jgi:Sap-like sulfolipid-1-addressing protein